MAFPISFTSGQFFEGKIFGSTSEDTTSVSEDEVLPEGLSWDLIPCEDEPRTGVAAPATQYHRRSTFRQEQRQQQQQQQQQSQQEEELEQVAQPDSNNPWLSLPVSVWDLQQPTTAKNPGGRPKKVAVEYNRPLAQISAAPLQQPAQTLPSETPASSGPASKNWELLPKNKGGRKRKRN